MTPPRARTRATRSGVECTIHEATAPPIPWEYGITIFPIRQLSFNFHPPGLCLIEVLSGKEVYDNILQHETVFNKKMAGENPTIPVTTGHEKSQKTFNCNCKIIIIIKVDRVPVKSLIRMVFQNFFFWSRLSFTTAGH